MDFDGHNFFLDCLWFLFSSRTLRFQYFSQKTFKLLFFLADPPNFSFFRFHRPPPQKKIINGQPLMVRFSVHIPTEAAANMVSPSSAILSGMWSCFVSLLTGLFCMRLLYSVSTSLVMSPSPITTCLQ